MSPPPKRSKVYLADAPDLFSSGAVVLSPHPAPAIRSIDINNKIERMDTLQC